MNPVNTSPTTNRNVKLARSARASLKEMGFTDNQIGLLFDAAGPVLALPAVVWGKSLENSSEDAMIQILKKLNLEFQKRIEDLTQKGIGRPEEGWPKDNSGLSCMIAGAMVARGIEPECLPEPRLYRYHILGEKLSAYKAGEALKALGCSPSSVSLIFDAAGPELSLRSLKWGRSLAEGSEAMMIDILEQLNLEISEIISVLT